MKTTQLEKELKKLQKKRDEEAKRKKIQTEIWVLKHPRLVSAGEKTRGGISRLGAGFRGAWQQMKEKEAAQRKAMKGKPQQSYSDRLSKAFG